MIQISTNSKWQNKQGAHDLAAYAPDCDANQNRTPCQEEPCLSIIPHPLNMLLKAGFDKVNKLRTEDHHG